MTDAVAGLGFREFFRDWSLSAIQQVAKGQIGVAQHHARTRITHHSLDLISAPRLIAVDRTLCTGRLCLLIGAQGQPSPCILKQVCAGGAESMSL